MHERPGEIKVDEELFQPVVWRPPHRPVAAVRRSVAVTAATASHLSFLAPPAAGLPRILIRSPSWPSSWPHSSSSSHAPLVSLSFSFLWILNSLQCFFFIALINGCCGFFFLKFACWIHFLENANRSPVNALGNYSESEWSDFLTLYRRFGSLSWRGSRGVLSSRGSATSPLICNGSGFSLVWFWFSWWRGKMSQLVIHTQESDWNVTGSATDEWARFWQPWNDFSVRVAETCTCIPQTNVVKRSNEPLDNSSNLFALHLI